MRKRWVTKRMVQRRAARRAKTAPKPPATVRVQLWLSSDVLAAFRAMGVGWQAKINEVLREWMRSHSQI